MMETEQLTQLINELVHPDAKQRRSAADALAGSDARAIYPLIKSLREENPGVQDAAMRSLIAIGGEVTAYMVLPLLREGPLLRNTTMVILKEIGPPTVPLLRLLFTDKDDDIRKFAVDLIGDIKTCDYPGEIVKLLQIDPNANVRASAAKSLAILNYREAIPALIAALRDEEWVCFSALDALAHFGDESSLGPVRALLSSPSSALRYAAIEALGKFSAPQARSILHDYLPKADTMEKNAVVKSLVQTGLSPSMHGVTDALLEILKKGDWEDRLIAIRGLVDMGEKRAIPIIIDTAGLLDPSDPRDDERLAAAKQALMDFLSPDDFIEALHNPSIKFRGMVIAIDILKELGCAEAVPHIIPLLKAVSTHVVFAAADAVMQLAGDEAPKILSFLKEHHDEGVKERVNRLLEGEV
jgi:HEAT repeat protein